MKNESVIIIGGDKRQEYIYNVLSADGYNCYIENRTTDYIEEKLSECRYVILPLPVSKDNKHIYCKNIDFILSFEDLCNMLTDRHKVFAGGLNKHQLYLLDEKEIKYYDYSDSEEFLVYNAFLTAQGALKLLLDNTDKSLTRNKALITGYGRIGKALANLLSKLNVSVTVCVRSNGQFNLAECMGFDAMKFDDLKRNLYDVDYVFNTVPQCVFNEEHIANMKSDAIYFELASAPYGVDRAIFDSRHARFVDGGALPGRYTPCSAGEIIAKIIDTTIRRSDSNGKET